MLITLWRQFPTTLRNNWICCINHNESGRIGGTSPEELLEKLAALVPPPRLNLVRYHGVLAPHAAHRAQIVPGPKAAHEETDTGGSEAQTTPPQRRHRLAWAVLLARVFPFDLSVCERCGGPVKIAAA